MEDKKLIEPVIRLDTCDPVSLTWQEFEQVQRDVTSRIIAGLDEPGDRILARLLREYEGRYLYCKQVMLDREAGIDPDE